MEFCPGTSLSQAGFAPIRFTRFHHHTDARDQAYRYVSSAAKLLAAFQGDGLEAIDHHAVTTRYRALFSRNFRAHSLDLPKPLLDEVELSVVAGLSPVPSQRLVAEHHDFGPWNITLGPHHWHLLDFGNFTFGYPEYDLASFCLALGLYSRHRTVDPELVSDLQRHFVESYHQALDNAPCLDTGLLKAFTLMHLSEFAYLNLTQRKAVAWVYLKPKYRFFIQLFERYLATSLLD
jgi:hypothetical protein